MKIKRILSPCEHVQIQSPLLTIRGIPGTISDHQNPSVSKPSRPAHLTAFKPVIAPMTIRDHQAGITETAPAFATGSATDDADLAVVVEAWDRLPESVRRLILKLVRANLKSFE
jgi:hypothetical protein